MALKKELNIAPCGFLLNRYFMEIITNIDNLSGGPVAATIGSFDGVHTGHAAMIKELQEAASLRGLPVMVITFMYHPRILFGAECEPFLLTTNNEKLAFLEELGVERCVLLDFDSSMASMSAERFMKEVLKEKLGVELLAVGYDHRFGCPQEGEGVDDYIAYGKNFGIDVFQTSQYIPSGAKVSSSQVRKALAAGDVEAAASLLGRAYSLEGVVAHGAALGRTIGYPTANIALSDDMKMLPRDGVYEVVVQAGGSEYKGVMNIGVKPTLQGVNVRTVEVYILDFSGDIYDEKISASFVRRLRDEVPFASVDALRLQIGVDVARVKRGI